MILRRSIAPNRTIPRTIITAGPLGRSIRQDKYNPMTETMVPIVQAIIRRENQLFAKRVEMEAGMTKKANTMRIPPILTE